MKVDDTAHSHAELNRKFLGGLPCSARGLSDTGVKMIIADTVREAKQD